MKQNVLIFPCGSEIGLEIHRSLVYSTHFSIIGGSSVNDHGKYVYRDYIGGIPSVEDDNFIAKLNGIIQERKIDYVFPAHDSVVLKLAQARSKGQLKCEVITSPIETCEVVRSKRKTYELFTGIIPVPELCEPAQVSESRLPLFLKPDVGQGSKGVQKVNSINDISFYMSKDPSLLLMEFLPGKEYTVDCFTNYKGELLFCEGRERRRVSNGISVNSKVTNDDRFKAYAKKINSTLKFKGVWFFQVKERKDGELVLMEIAPRIAGTMGLARSKGVNLALLSLFNAVGYDVGIIENAYEMSIDRALHNSYEHNIQYNHAYIDLDDTLVADGRINIQLISFIFQCINNGVGVHLITRHKNVLEESLRTHRLTNLFDEIIWIKPEGEKHKHIKHKDSIFIDDSYAERKNVSDVLGIPVFDPHMVEGLMEGF